MDAHRIFSLVVIMAGAATALLGIGIVTVAMLVRARAASAARRMPSFDA
ncbi:MAG TPA: hypothetical protein VJ818_08705 [Actinomycetota bacterium]|nr:hypothetical protein [Actinomycetota bacterium]